MSIYIGIRYRYYIKLYTGIIIYCYVHCFIEIL
jgi:hypothetical protein